MNGVDRPRWLYFLATLAVIAVGLFTRSEAMSTIVPLYVGDGLWAVMFFLGFAVLLPTASTARVTLFAAAVVFGLEFLQLAEWPWLLELRNVKVARYLLGTTFAWSDVIGLAVGLAAVAAADRFYLGRLHR